MSAFTGPLDLRELDTDRDEMQLLEPLPWEVGELGSGVFIIVPPGFVSDGGTIPPPFSWVLPKWGRNRRAFVLHDHLCGLIRAGTPHPNAPTRRAADRIFAAADKACGTAWPVRAIFYAGVRIGAWTGIGTPRGA